MDQDQSVTPTTRMQDRFMRLNEVREHTSLSTTTIYVMAKRGEFPKPIALSRRCSAWKESDVQRWMNEKINKAKA